MTAEKLTVQRDGSVVLGDQVIGSVFGEPRNWCFITADGRVPPRLHVDGWHSKREAAEMCAAAWRKTRPADPGRGTEYEDWFNMRPVSVRAAITLHRRYHQQRTNGVLPGPIRDCDQACCVYAMSRVPEEN